MYIWLIKPTEKQMTDLKAQGIRVETDGNTTRSRIFEYSHPLTPGLDISAIPKELIGMFTHQESICRGFRPEGLYQHGGAEMLLRTVPQDSYMEADFGGFIQEMSICAPTLDALKEIYTMVRSGKLQPEMLWDTPVCHDET